MRTTAIFVLPLFCFLQVTAKCYTSISGIVMTNSTLSSFNANNFSDCFDKCKQQEKCRSVNYFLKTSLCQLNKRKISDKPENKIDDDSCVYMDNPNATGKYVDPDIPDWVLVARFSNVDTKNWMATSGAWWYDVTTEKGDSTSTVLDQDLIAEAFWTRKGQEIKITRTDDANHTPLLLTTSNCLGGKTFREMITSYGNFRNGAIWSSNICLAKCNVVYAGNYATTAGFSRTSCDSNVLTRNQMGFWCDWSAGAGAVISIGGAGSACDRADHGLAVTEENAGKLGLNQGCDFGDNGASTCVKPGYALNVWIK